MLSARPPHSAEASKWHLADGLFWLLAVSILAWVAYDGILFKAVIFGKRSDIWEHVAVLNTWSQNLFDPLHPHVADEGSASLRYTPLYFLYAGFIWLFEMKPLNAVGLAAVTHTIVLLLSLRWFCKNVFDSLWAPVIAVAVLFCVWGTGWGWSNAYDLRAYLLVASYPSIGAFAFTFTLWAWVHNKLSQNATPSFWQHALSACLMAFIVLSHPLTGVLAFVGAVSMAVFSPDIERQRRIVVLLSLMSGLVLCFLWPWYSIWGLIIGNETNTWVDVERYITHIGIERRLSEVGSIGRGQYFYDFENLWNRGGAALLGIPALMLVAFDKKQRWLSVAGFALLLPLLINLFVPLPLGHRFFFFVAVFGHLSLVSVCVNIVQWPGPLLLQRSAQVLVFVALSFAVITHVEYSFQYYVKLGPHADLKPNPSPIVRRFEALSQVLPQDAVVMTDLETAFVLPGFRGKVIAPLRGDHLVKDRIFRRHIVRLFYDPKTNDAWRRKILEYYNVTHILIRDADATPELLAFCESVGDRLKTGTNDNLYKVM